MATSSTYCCFLARVWATILGGQLAAWQVGGWPTGWLAGWLAGGRAGWLGTKIKKRKQNPKVKQIKHVMQQQCVLSGVLDLEEKQVKTAIGFP